MNGGARILVVDDEPQIQRFLRPALIAAGYEVLQADGGADALRLAATQAPDLVILDLGLPDLDGHDVLRRLRDFSAVPVVILSARDRETEKISALDQGADDYVAKPFGIGELLARVRAALRHGTTARGEATRYQGFGVVVDLDQRRVTRDGETVKLTVKELEVLALLARHAGRVVTHRQILETVWGRAHAEDTQYLRVLMGRLRQKLEATPAEPQLLLTEQGVGYRLALEE